MSHTRPRSSGGYVVINEACPEPHVVDIHVDVAGSAAGPSGRPRSRAASS